jgi:serine phosphatase RsbU (regulator of sigma subunit)
MRAKNVFNQLSPEKLFYITIKPPFWKTTWFISIVTVFSIFIVYLVIVFRLKALERANKVLEEKVRVRTQQVLEQKEELVKQKDIIENLYSEVTDSIEYAQKIQLAILPSEQQIKSLLHNAFVFFKPKNIVSGDFYWFAERPDRYIIAAVDCTGHGVPGAFMSMIGNTLLNQIINERNIVEPAEALNHLHKGIRRLLKQDQADNLQKDGMDIVLLSVHKFRNEVQYAGANNSLFYVENNEIKEIKADKFSIGGLQKEQERKFTNHTLQISTKTSFFLTSDGYQDQFDEAFENKFTARRLKQLFLEIASLDGDTQKEKLDKTITEFRGTEEQMDDLMVIGFTINPE